MKAFVRNHTMLTALGVIPVLFFGLWFLEAGWTLSAAARGSVAARFDVDRGHYEIQAIGLATPWRPKCAALLRERYGVEQRTVAGCCVTESLDSYIRAYNGVMRSAALRKFGHDVFAECAADARNAFVFTDNSQ